MRSTPTCAFWLGLFWVDWFLFTPVLAWPVYTWMVMWWRSFGECGRMFSDTNYGRWLRTIPGVCRLRTENAAGDCPDQTRSQQREHFQNILRLLGRADWDFWICLQHGKITLGYASRNKLPAHLSEHVKIKNDNAISSGCALMRLLECIHTYKTMNLKVQLWDTETSWHPNTTRRKRQPWAAEKECLNGPNNPRSSLRKLIDWIPHAGKKLCQHNLACIITFLSPFLAHASPAQGMVCWRL